ncbi:MAG: trehalase family glycosidase [bacterium]|nr:trehalase family glycosidase [bacterium]
MSKLQKQVQELYLRNRRIKDGFQFTLPAPSTYPYQWFWDSCFHAIVLSHLNVEDAKKELRSVVAKQFENGMIPHMIYWEKSDLINIDWGREGTSSLIQPPMLAHAVWTVFEKSEDKNFLEEMYAPLYHFYNYLLTERDPRGNHLAGIIHPDESGEDNSPRFDGALDLPPRHEPSLNTQKRMELVRQNASCNFDAPFCMKNFFWVKDVPFNSIFAENLRVLAKIAAKLDHKDDALKFNEQYLLVVKAMRERMVEDGLFWSTYGVDYKKIKVLTWAIFAPLFAKILSHEEAQTLVDNHLLNPKEFWTKYPVPTVAKTDPSFDPKGFWRGPTWIATNWFIYHGLMNYGMTDAAQEIKNSSLRLLQKSGFREQFDPETGEGLGAYDFTWGGLVLDMK